MAEGRFIAYEPTSLRVVGGRSTSADPASIRADLVTLRPRFDGLITYEALHGTESIPAIATSIAYRTLVIGVWNPLDDGEVHAAIAAARSHPALVAGLSLGNELLFGQRQSLAELTAAIRRIHREAPEIPLSTTEPFHTFERPEMTPLLGELDFLLANVHPVFQPWFRSAPDRSAARFVVNVADDLATIFCGPILIKETGVPTAPSNAGFTASRQASFFEELRRQFPGSSDRAFAYFSAFDAPWRLADWHPVAGEHPEEAHWGLYDENRRAKPAADEVPRLAAAHR